MKISKILMSLVATFVLVFLMGTESMAAKKSKTLKNTIKKGFVRCGVSQGLPGFSNADASGNWTGVDVDVCRAVAAAVLGDASKVKFTPLSAKEKLNLPIVGIGGITFDNQKLAFESGCDAVAMLNGLFS